MDQSLELPHDQDLYIDSNIEVNCSASNAMKIEWTVKLCDSSCESMNHIYPSIVFNATDLFLPAGTLPYGYHLFELVVTMVALPSSPESDITLVKIIPRNVTVNLVPLGTSMITHGRSQDLLIDPGSFSTNLALSKFDEDVSDAFSEFQASPTLCVAELDVQVLLHHPR